MRKLNLLVFIMLLALTDISAQRELIMSQYMYNKYSINPAFGGSHESLSTYGSFRKKWAGFEKSPSGAFFTVHSPLKNERVALGAQFFNDQVGIISNTGFSVSYAYRLQLQNDAKLSLGISGGLVSYKSDWTDVLLVDTEDNTFAAQEQTSAPWIGFGAALLHKNYFAGFSVPSLLFYDRYETGESTLDFAKIDYLFTGGYMFNLSDAIVIQPSAMLRVNMDQETFVDISATGFLMNAFILGTSYRTTGEIVGIVGYQLTSQFRFTYSLDYDIDPIGSYNNGTHEVALQFNFGYKINSPNPKFF